ncbi:MAG: hydrogenase nickel incorporation protein HypB [Calditrichia bacterium]|nr:hydrogenase nickel incorporation protein HypB [Calditrichia bacterium]MCK5455217.1 hydrogenase nickel incorporation protein HypB [Calditrichia bacterium]
MSVLTIERKVLEKNDIIADSNRKLFKSQQIFSINLVSSPGSGKTSLVEKTIEYCRDKIKMGVVEGDIQTDLDAKRVDALGIPVVQIVTHGACHLEAALVRDSLNQLPLSSLELVIIENVGNLVCPSGYDLGEDKKVVIVSTTEGDDKPLKYPAMFRNAEVLIINKIDLAPYLNTAIAELEKNALSINSELQVFKTSCTTGEGIEAWCQWLESQIVRK